SVFGADGYFFFDNSIAYDGLANAQLPFLANPQSSFPAGTIIGSDPTFATPNYRIGFLWQPGTANLGMDPGLFYISGATVGSTTTSFYGKTGDTVNGAG